MKILSFSRLSLTVGLALGIMVVWMTAAPSVTTGSPLYGGAVCWYCHANSWRCQDLPGGDNCFGDIDQCESETSGTYRTCYTPTPAQTPCFGYRCGLKEEKEEDCK